MNNNKKLLSYQIVMTSEADFLSQDSTIEKKREALSHTCGILLTYSDGTQRAIDTISELENELKNIPNIEEKKSILQNSKQSVLSKKDEELYLWSKKPVLPSNAFKVFTLINEIKYPMIKKSKPISTKNINNSNAKGTVRNFGVGGIFGALAHRVTYNRKGSSKMKEIAIKKGDWFYKYGQIVATMALIATLGLGLCIEAYSYSKSAAALSPSSIVRLTEKEEQSLYLEQKEAFCSMTDTLAARLPNELILFDGTKTTLTDEEKANYAISGHEFDTLRTYFSDQTNFMETVGLKPYVEMRESRNIARNKLLILATQATENEFGLFDNLFKLEEDKKACRQLMANLINGCTPEVAMEHVLGMWNLENPQMKAFIGSIVIPMYSAAGIIDESDINKHNFTFELREFNQEAYDEKVGKGMIPVHEIEERYCGATALIVNELSSESIELQKEEKSSFFDKNQLLNEKHNHDISLEKTDDFFKEANKMFEAIYTKHRINIGTLPKDFVPGQVPTGGAYSETKNTVTSGNIGSDGARAMSPAEYDRIQAELAKKTAQNKSAAEAQLKNGSLPNGVDSSTIGSTTGNEGETVRKEETTGDTVVTENTPSDGPDYKKDENGNFVEIPGTAKPSEPTGAGDLMNGLIDSKNNESSSGPENGMSNGGIISTENGDISTTVQPAPAPVSVEQPALIQAEIEAYVDAMAAPVGEVTPEKTI